MATTFDYQEYLASREWALLKNQVRERSGGTCERCGQAPHQSTHHKTYARIGRELLDDLLGVCNPCHEWLSGKSDADPAEIKAIAVVGAPPLLPMPMRWVSQTYDEDCGQQMLCPVCDFEYVHLSGSRQVAKGDEYQAGWVRGNVLGLHFWCENSHHFTIEFGFHKGYTFVRYAPTWGTYWSPDGQELCPDCKTLA